MSLWGDVKHIGNGLMHNQYTGPAIGFAMNPVLPAFGAGLFNGFHSPDNEPDPLEAAGFAPPNALDGINNIANNALGNVAGTLEWANNKNLAAAQPKPQQDLIEQYLASIMKQKQAPSLSEKVINKYLSQSLSPYDSAISGLQADYKDGSRQNNQMAGNLDRDLAVHGKTARAIAAQTKRENARQAGAAVGEQAATDAMLAQTLGAGFGGSGAGKVAGATATGRAGVVADQAGRDTAADLGGEADATFSDEARQWAKSDAAEQNRQLQRRTQKGVADLRGQRAAKEAEIQFALAQEAQKQQSALPGQQLDALALLSQHEFQKDQLAQKQQNPLDILKLLIASGGNTVKQPLFEIPGGGGFTTQMVPGATPAIGGGKPLSTEVQVPSPYSGLLQQLLMQTMPQQAGATRPGWIDPTNYTFG